MEVRIARDQKGTTYALWQEGNLAFLGMPVYVLVTGAQIKAHYIMAETGWERTTIRRDIKIEDGYRLGVAYKIPDGVKEPLDVMESAVKERGHLNPTDDPDWQL